MTDFAMNQNSVKEVGEFAVRNWEMLLVAEAFT
jgi:hypothetical protein